MIVNEEFRRALWEKLQTFQKEAILAAVDLSWEFPPPEAQEGPQDTVAQTIHDIALHAESLGDWELCKSLYRRVPDYPAERREIAADSRYRYAYCLERQGRLIEAIRAYRGNLATEVGVSATLTGLTRLRLARLLMDAEEYEEALELLEELAQALPVDRVDTHEVLTDLGRCALRLGRFERARQALQQAVETTLGLESEIEALRMLAEAHERLSNPQAAIECYRRLVDSNFSEPRTKAAATVRLNALGAG